MTNQEVFDKVAVHLLTQGVRSTNLNQCYYRGINNTKCAIGCLIEDADYDALMDIHRMSVSSLFQEKKFQNKPSIQKLKKYNLQNLIELQDIHDYYEPYTWYKYLVKFASIGNLNTDAIHKWKPDIIEV